MLNLAEELLLLCQLDGKGKLYSGSLDLAVDGGILAELLLAGRLRLDEGSLAVVDGSATGNQYLDEALVILAPGNTWKPEDPEWLAPIIYEISFSDKLVSGLIFKGILRREEKRTLGILRGIKYVQQDPSIRQRLVNQERQIMIEGEAPDARSATRIYLTSILGEADPVKLSRKEKKAYQNRWEALFGDHWGQYPADQLITPIAGLDPTARASIGYLAVALGTLHSSMYIGATSRNYE
jgi:hypothetical protein